MMLAYLIFLLPVVFCSVQEQNDLVTAAERLDRVQKRLAESKRKIKEQDEVIRHMYKDAQQQETTIKSLLENNYQQAVKLKSQKNQIKEIGEYAETPLGFTAYAGATREYEVGDTIQFELVITNRGLNYNPSTSTFTVSQAGIYLFSVTLYALESDTITGDIQQNNNAISQVYSSDTVQRDQATNAVIVECAVGDVITVVVSDVDGPLEGFADNAITTFSGTLIIRL